MPLYEYICRQCGHHGERIVAMVDSHKDQPCGFCDGKMKRIISPVNFNMGPCGAYGYYDENLEAYVGTNKQRRQLMEERGVTEYGGTPKPEGQAWV